MARRVSNRWKMVIDPRTSTMSLEALTCRHRGHPWDYVPLGPVRRAELRRLGQTELLSWCPRCESRKTELLSLPDLDPVRQPKIDYSDEYLLAAQDKGTGRLPRREAKKAMFARLNPDLV
jgi:hypothetical protein